MTLLKTYGQFAMTALQVCLIQSFSASYVQRMSDITAKPPEKRTNSVPLVQWMPLWR